MIVCLMTAFCITETFATVKAMSLDGDYHMATLKLIAYLISCCTGQNIVKEGQKLCGNAVWNGGERKTEGRGNGKDEGQEGVKVREEQEGRGSGGIQATVTTGSHPTLPPSYDCVCLMPTPSHPPSLL